MLLQKLIMINKIQNLIKKILYKKIKNEIILIF